MRKLICELLESDPNIEVVDTARDGYEAVEKVAKLHPDVVTMDVQMPRMSGLEALSHIMSQCPTPVIILTGLNNPQLAIEALERGAVDFVLKPSGTISMDIYKIRQELIQKVKLAPLVNIRKMVQRGITSSLPPLKTPFRIPGKRVVVIGASTGGPRALNHCLS
ncbi:MAG TPA: response regulator, partial [Chloroflexi bacterium]|nr:response regulator [Chloroflexota bacterium]